MTFPLEDVKVQVVQQTRRVSTPLLEDPWMALNQNEFWMRVEGTASYYASHGRNVEVAVEEKADPATVNLYLQGSVFGAILHQRSVLPLHGSSFYWKGKGICICGETLAGKSSLSVAFCLDGATYLADDVTPVVMRNNKPLIFPRTGHAKLWKDSLDQLGLDASRLEGTGSDEAKYYQPLPQPVREPVPLDHIIILEVPDMGYLNRQTLTGIQAFTALRNQIYRWEYLPAMPKTEANYLQQLIDISKTVRISRVIRPQNMGIAETRNYLTQLI